MQPDPYHAVPEEKRNINGFRTSPSGALVTDTPPFDRLFEEGTGNGLYALAVQLGNRSGSGRLLYQEHGAPGAYPHGARCRRKAGRGGCRSGPPAGLRYGKSLLAEQFPPVPGAEYATPDIIAGWFEDLRKAIAKEIRARGITPRRMVEQPGRALEPDRQGIFPPCGKPG